MIKKQLKEWNDKIKMLIIKSRFELYDKYKFEANNMEI